MPRPTRCNAEYTAKKVCQLSKTIQHSLRVEEDAFEFGTKAETLALLNGRLEVGQFVAQLYFDMGSWRQDQDGVLNDIATQFPGGLLAVRSSAVSELSLIHI